MEARLAALLRLLADADGDGMSHARVARRLGLAASELQRLLAVLGDDAVVGGLGLVCTREDGGRTLLSLTAAGHEWLERHR
jgi:DNA-binding IclR family transcriptional regulator